MLLPAATSDPASFIAQAMSVYKTAAAASNNAAASAAAQADSGASTAAGSGVQGGSKWTGGVASGAVATGGPEQPQAVPQAPVFTLDSAKVQA